MTEHVHEWMKYFATEYGDKFVVKERYIAICKLCPEKMTLEDGLTRINATERLEEVNKGLFNIIKAYHPEYIDGCECPQCGDMPIYFDTLEGKP